MDRSRPHRQTAPPRLLALRSQPGEGGGPLLKRAADDGHPVGARPLNRPGQPQAVWARSPRGRISLPLRRRAPCFMFLRFNRGSSRARPTANRRALAGPIPASCGRVELKRRPPSTRMPLPYADASAVGPSVATPPPVSPPLLAISPPAISSSIRAFVGSIAKNFKPRINAIATMAAIPKA